MVELHAVASTRLAHAALPGMLARGRGFIINVASLLAFVPFPGSVTYCATKSYLVMFSRALDLEVRRRGVRVQALCPGFTRTEFHDAAQLREHDLSRFSGFLWSSADEVVAASLRGLDRGQLVCIPGVKNRLLVALGGSPLAAPIIGRLIR